MTTHTEIHTGAITIVAPGTLTPIQVADVLDVVNTAQRDGTPIIATNGWHIDGTKPRRHRIRMVNVGRKGRGA